MIVLVLALATAVFRNDFLQTTIISFLADDSLGSGYGCIILNTQQDYDVAHDAMVRAMAGLYFFILLAYDVTARAEAGLYKYLFGL